MYAAPFGSLQNLHDLFVFLREFNIYMAGVLFLGCIFRLARIFIYWHALSKNDKLYQQLNMEKMVCWCALSIWAISTFVGSFSHKVYNSNTGIFIPLTTLAIALTALGIFFARKVVGLPFKQKDKT